MYIIETNVVSELRKPTANPQVLAWFSERRPADMYLSAVTVFELELGVQRLERRDQIQGRKLRRWLDQEVLDLFSGRILPVDTPVTIRSAGLHVPDPRPERDCLIAATALVHNMSVVTRNIKDFQPLTVRCIDPWLS